ncbi:MAG TPA: hypothetical protein ENI15_09920 [Spirochaetes bacterium]|nr:hypothetical protein [Spirochaetota bacterium]
MGYYNYADITNFVFDKDLQKLLCLDRDFENLLSDILKEDFLEIDATLRIPFFAETRDYVGAREKDDPDATWIVRQVSGDDIIQTEMATICYFIDFYTRAPSAPIVITMINGTPHKATKLMTRAEQLSGANYTEDKQLMEQLLLDIINRWIYFDEDRNPNNYMIKYNSKGDQIIVPIDFLNVDLIADKIKIKGLSDRFGWERKEKTRYLTPLKSENWLNYDIKFFDIRFDLFKELDKPFLVNVCNKILKWNEERDELSGKIAGNLVDRVQYLYSYFKSHISEESVDRTKKKYSDMGRAFGKYI